jgi:hypothetical protein
VIETTGASAVLVGKDGLGPWQDAEMRGCLSEFVDRKLPVIPVLLPGAPEVPRLPIFLKGFTWVDLRGGLTADGMNRLQWGITGRRPPDAPRASGTMPQTPKRRWFARPLPLLLVAASLTAVFALGLFLRQQALLARQMKRMKGTPGAGEAASLKTSACVPGEESTQDGIAYVRICPGTFTMGSADDDS